jgi:hypothetical protein
MKRILTAAGSFLWLATVAAFAQTDTPQVRGMPLATLQGPYQYTSGGSRVKGYVVLQPIGASPNLSAAAPDDVVDFQLCESDEHVKVKRALLQKASPCRITGPSMWSSWMLQNGNLVAKGPGNAHETVPIGELPEGWQTIFKPGDPNQVRALSFPSGFGPDTFAIIVKPTS